MNLVPKYWKQILLLLIITPFLTELLTNNIPAPQFFRPKQFFILAILGYGPVLLLREFAVRWKLNFTGYIVLGLVYGLYNEGLLAQTIFKAELPNPSFNNYGTLLGVNFSWASIILIFHAFYAFLFPILTVYYLFPSAAAKPWIDKRIWLLLSTLLFLYISKSFLKSMHKQVTLYHYLFLVISMIGLVMASKNFSRKMIVLKKMKLWPMLISGFVFVVALFPLSDRIIHAGVNALIFITYMLAILLGTIFFLQKRPVIKSLIVFGLSAEITFALCTLLVAGVTGSDVGMITAVVFVAIFALALAFVLMKKENITQHL